MIRKKNCSANKVLVDALLIVGMSFIGMSRSFGAIQSQEILHEDFESGMSCRLSSVGSFTTAPGIKSGMGYAGSRGFGFGRSPCMAEAWYDYVNDLTFVFPKKYVITKVVFREMMRYDNYGSQGYLLSNGKRIADTVFGRLPINDHHADSGFRKRVFNLNITTDNLTFRCWDVTNASELFIDEIRIYGYSIDAVDLHVSQDLPNYIKLEWSCPLEGLEYKVYRSASKDGPFEPIPDDIWLNCHGYLDGNVPCGVYFYYKVQSSLGVFSDSDIGVRGGEFRASFTMGSKNPTIIGRSNEPWILIAGQEFTCKVNFRELDPRCEIQEIFLKGDPKTCAKERIRVVYSVNSSRVWNGDWIKARKSDIPSAANEYAFVAKLPCGPGRHGRYTWTLSCRYRKDERSYLVDLSKPMEQNVYFDKYASDSGEEKTVCGVRRKTPNWFAYWKQDGACPVLWDSTVEYRGKRRATKVINGKTYIISPGGMYDGNKVYLDECACDDCGAVRIHNPKWSEAEQCFGYDKNGRCTYGVFTVAHTIAHEKQHRETESRYVEKRVIGGLKDSDLERWTFVFEDRSKHGFMYYVFHPSNKPLHEICDSIVDDDEINKYADLGLNITNTDTYGFANLAVQYGGYGDNELVSYVEGRRGENYAFPHNDWAYPGEQSGDAWFNVSQAQVTHLYPNKGNEKLKLQAVKSMMESEITEESCQSNLLIAVSDVKGEVLRAENSVTGVVYEIDLELKGGLDVEFVGYLHDNNGNVVATASAYANETSESVKLLFNAADIYSSGSAGPYALGRVEVNVNAFADKRVGEFTDFKVEPLAVSRQELGGPCGYLRSAEECGVVDGLGAKVTAEISLDGVYCLEGDLLSIEGDVVAHASTEAICAVGDNDFTLAFAGAEIYRTGVVGDVHLGNVRLWREDTLICARSEMLTFAHPLNNNDFRPSDACVFVGRDSGCLETVAGIEPGTYGGFTYALDVTNTSSTTLCYSVSGFLCGTNDAFVARLPQSYVYLTNGVNRLTVTFSGAAISEAKIDGPYRVRQFDFESQDEIGNDVRVYSHVKSPAYKATDFAAASVSFSGAVARVVRAGANDSLVVAFDYESSRGCKVVAAATLIDTNGNFVARAYSTNTVRRAGSWTAQLEFSLRELAKENVGGPYRVAYFSLTSLEPGEESVVSDSLEIRDVVWLTPVAQLPIEVPEDVDWDSLFSWTVSGNDAVACRYLGTNAHDVVVVPSEHDGLPVTQIAENCFNSNLTVKAVVVSDGIVGVGDAAFGCCEMLKTVSLPESLERIGRYAFSGCLALERVHLPDSLREIDEGAFLGAVSLEALWIPAGVLNMPKQMSSKCSNLAKVAFPPLVTNVGAGAFQDCTMLSEVVFPSRVINVDDQAFARCSGVTNFVFRGPPPIVGVMAFPQGVRACYSLTYQSDWESEIVDGLWNGLQMHAEALPRMPSDMDVNADDMVFDGEDWLFEGGGTSAIQSLRNAPIGDGQQTSMTTTLVGAGIVSFDWRTSCEDMSGDASLRDHAEFLIDGKVVATSEGESVWKEVSIDLSGGTSHTVTWRYVKDGSGSAGQDCVWVSDIQFAAIADEETSDELLDESEYNWFYEDTPVQVTKAAPFEYNPSETPEESTCQVDIQSNIGLVPRSVLQESMPEGVQAGICRVADAVGLEYAVVTSDGWETVGNANLTMDEEENVKVSFVVDYSTTPSTIKYMISGHTLTNAEGTSMFVCAAQKSHVESLFAKSKGSGEIHSWAGKYDVVNADVLQVAPGTETELAAGLDTFQNETFQVSGGGTLVIPGDKIPAGGVNRRLHVDGNSAVKFDLSGLSPIPSVTKLFNGVGNSFSIGNNVQLFVPGEGVERVSKLFVKDGNLEARVAERPTLGDGGSADSAFRVNSDGISSTASASIGNAVEGFWYGLLTAGTLLNDFMLDYDSLKQCTSTGVMKLDSSANAAPNSGFYRVMVSAERP